MNSYNENLNANVVASLQNQELEQNKMEAQLKASMFTLYYAEGAKITAQEKLDKINLTYVDQQKTKEKAVTNNNIATNLLASANQEKQYVAQTITNTSVAASNVQLSANAILRLAGDMGSVLNMLNGADFGSQIYELAEEINKIMNDTAYSAEYASQLAMESASLTAEVSASTVADKAKVTGALVSDLLSVVSSQFDNTSAMMDANNEALALACVEEKKAEGELEDVNVEYYAARAAYLLSIKELNLNLQVNIPERKGPDYSYYVTFENYLNPFYNSLDDALRKYHNCPVSNYYIILVKDSKKSTFSLARAEELVTKGIKRQFINVKTDPSNDNPKIEKEIFISDLNDSDDDPTEMGEKYVVFVMAQLNEAYKKAINNFDDFLTAPSAPFILTNKLNSPGHQFININQPVKADISKSQILEFALMEDKQYNVEYRCMFLPDNMDLIEGLLTENGLRKIEEEVLKYEEIAELYDPKILANEKAIVDCNVKVVSLKQKIEINLQHTERTPELKEELEKLEIELAGVSAELKQNRTELATNQKAKKAALATINLSEGVKPGFFFNLTLAEQVTAGSYSVSKSFEREDRDNELELQVAYMWFKSSMHSKGFHVSSPKKGDKGIHFTISKAGQTETIKIQINEKKGLSFDLTQIKEKELKQVVAELTGGYKLVYQQLIIDGNINDNFGNPLVDKKKYIPVVLSYSKDNDQGETQFTNSLSAYAETKSFIYTEKNNN